MRPFKAAARSLTPPYNKLRAQLAQVTLRPSGKLPLNHAACLSANPAYNLPTQTPKSYRSNVTEKHLG